MAAKCEKCGGRNTYTDANGIKRVADMVDYCAVCGANLCDKCMAAGHCGHKPALSGEAADYPDETAVKPPK